MAVRPWRAVLLVVALLAATDLTAQAPVRGTVVADAGGAPVAGALVALKRAGTATTTDGLGRFTLPPAPLPDTLLSSAIGWVPDTTVLTEPAGVLEIRLARAPVVVSDLIVSAPALQSLDLSEHGRWRMQLAAARTVPPAVETDIFRALALVPAVSFTSPLSARPMIRGYDAQEVATRIDGFEMPNLYHLGRVFSAYPADATEQVAVTTAPYTSGSGGSIAGIIDVTGRTGSAEGVRAGGGVSFGSAAAYAGGGNRRTRVFGAARVLHLKTLDLIPGVRLPYQFADLYGGAVFGPPERPSARVTLFATHDDVGDEDSGLAWYNVLLGGRWRVHGRGPVSIDLHASGARFDQTGRKVPSLHRATADFENEFSRIATGLDLVITRPGWRVSAGASAGWRRVENRIRETFPVGLAADYPPTDTQFGRIETGGHLEVSRRLGRLTFEAGLRADAAGRTATAEPRFHARWSGGPNFELSGGVGRTSRNHHLIADARSEPDVEFLDFWLNPGDSVPLAQVDHVSFDLTFDRPPLVARVSIFGSRGNGLGELRPESDQQIGPFPFFRFGRSRTRGFEVQLAVRGGARLPRSLSASYVLSRSERDWGDGWVPWAQDRRHQLRLFGQLSIGRLTLFATADGASGMPLTPVVGQIQRVPPGGDPLSFPIYGGLADLYGRENSASTSGTFRLDGGANLTFGGPFGRRFTVGASVINLLGSPVAPIADRGEGRTATDRRGQPTPYRRLFDLPPIPTLTLRAEFGPGKID